MQFVLVFGTNYYYSLDAVPVFVQHAMRLITARWGNDLDNGTVPAFARLKAHQLLTRYGSLNA